MIGIFTGAGAAGQVLGPAVGGLAVVTSRIEVFGAMAAMAAILALVGSRFSGPAHGRRQSLALIKQAHRSRDVVGGLWLVVVPGLLIGTIFVLGPLQLNRLGSGPIGIAGAFLGASAVGVLGRPVIGRWADRNGQLRAIRLLLLVSIPLTLVVPWGETAGCSPVVWCSQSAPMGSSGDPRWRWSHMPTTKLKSRMSSASR